VEEALIARLRASEDIRAVAGTVGARAAIDLHERKSNAETAFPACVVTAIAPGRTYSQDGPDRLRRRLVRFDCFALSAGASIMLARAIIGECERPALLQGVQFAPGQLRFERSLDPEDFGTLRIFRTVADLIIPANC
jgi:hypothetical protein